MVKVHFIFVFCFCLLFLSFFKECETVKAIIRMIAHQQPEKFSVTANGNKHETVPKTSNVRLRGSGTDGKGPREEQSSPLIYLILQRLI